MNHLLIAAAAVVLALPAAACDAPVTAAVVEEIHRVEGKKVVFLKQTRGVMKPLVEKATTDYRSTVIAEEILADFESRNGTVAEPQLPNAIDLKDYTSAGALDWERLDRDFPGTPLVVELSRPGCDSQEVFAVVQARYHNRRHDVHEGVLFHLAKDAKGIWKWQRSTVANAGLLAQ